MRKTLDLHEIQRTLEEQQEILIQRLENAADVTITADNPDRADLAERVIEEERQGLLMARAKGQLEDTKAALRRIKNGTYGLCQVCGHPIHPERLRVIPTTTACIDCK